uniref:C2H2-type domain-containing protein n=1 Tax=Labrus bergylta TaxID=56723 RepID=A0A3Q3F9H1_9LABR
LEVLQNIMKLRKKSRKKYEVVDTLSGCRQESVVFNCWFCGRLFNNQEDWIGHGQRHLMEIEITALIKQKHIIINGELISLYCGNKTF